MPSKYVKRITLFKIPQETDVDAVLKQYDMLRNNAQKDGRPYIISIEANRVINTSEQRSQGYTLAVQTTFSCLADVEYYDNECEAHKSLKAVATPVRTAVATMLFESDLKPEA